MGTLVNGIKEIFATAKTTGSNVMLCGNDGTPDGHMTMANLASVLGEQFAGAWTGGSFENMANLTDGRRVYYVDQDSNGHSQYDFPFQYCVVSIDKTHWARTRFVMAFAFDIVTGQTKIYRDGGGGDRIYNWQDVAIGYPSFYKDYTDLSSLANALGEYPTNHALIQIADSNKTGLEIAKDYFLNQMQSSVAFLLISPADSNIFVTIYKDYNGGRMEFHGVSDGTTTVYKKGYSDSDFVLIQ